MTAVIPACESSPCANDGICTSKGPFAFTCQCAVGYTGSTCEVNIDDCVSVTCPSNSMCVDGINTFECVCLPGFEDSGNICVLVSQTDNTNPSTVPNKHRGECNMYTSYIYLCHYVFMNLAVQIPFNSYIYTPYG